MMSSHENKATVTRMARKMVWSFPLFVVLTMMGCRDDAIASAFTAKSNVCRPVPSTPVRTVRWSSSEASVVDEESATKIVTDEESSSEDEEKVNESSALEVNTGRDTNEDPGIDAMMNETVTAEKKSEHESEEENLMQQIKDSGVAGVISYAAWELAFWTISVPVCVLGYKEVTGHWPDLSDKDDLSKLGAEAFAFVNFARFAVPLRIGLALGTTPWIQENIVDVFLVDKEGNDDMDEEIVEVVEEECEESDEDSGEIIVKKEGGRFRIRSRLRNLITRIFTRKKKDHQGEKE